MKKFLSITLLICFSFMLLSMDTGIERNYIKSFSIKRSTHFSFNSAPVFGERITKPRYYTAPFGRMPVPTFIEKDTIVTVAPNVTWKATFRVPDFLYSRNGVDSGHMFINFLGSGQSSSNSYGDGSMTQYGDLDAVHSGWDGGVPVGGVIHYPIIIHISQQSAVPANVIARVPEAIKQFVSRFRVKTFVKNGARKYMVHLTGLSAGGGTAKLGVMSDTAFAKTYIASIVDVEGVKPDDISPYPARLASVARAGVRIWFLEGGNDGRDQTTQRNTMNAAVPGSAIHTITTAGQPMYGHSGWNWAYGGNGNGTLYSSPYVFTNTTAGAGVDGHLAGQDVRAWRIRQGDSTNFNTGSTLPIASAGPDQTIFWTVGQVNLDASGSVDGDGGTLTYSWQKISGPGTTSIPNPTNAQVTASGLIQGNYVFRVTVTDPSSNTATDDVNIKVQAPPAVNAGPDQSIAISTATLAATSTDEGSIAWNLVSKVKAPGQAVRRFGFVGSSTGAGYNVALDSAMHTIVKNFYKGIGVIDTLINLSVVSTNFWNGLANGTPVPAGRPAPDPTKNINAAKAAGVTDLFWTYTTNGLDDPTLTWDIYYDAMKKARDSTVANGMTFWIFTPKTRDGFSPTEEQKLSDFADSTIKYFPLQVIDVWHGFTDGNTTATKPEFNKGDLVHWNGLGHLQAAKTVIGKNVLKSIVSSPAVITNSASLTTTITGLTSGAPHIFQVTSRDNDSLYNYDIISIETSVSGAVTNTCRVGAPVVWTLTKTATNEIYDPYGGQTANVKGGDTIRIPAGNYDVISLGGIIGSAGCKVVIVNYGGRVSTKIFRIAEMVISPVKQFKLIGIGTYGFFIGDSTTALSNSNGLAISYASNFEITNVEVTGTLIGMYFKQQPSTTNANANYPIVATMDSVYAHHNYIHDVHGEGMYFGDTYPNADPYVGNVVPGRLNHVEISYNIVDGTDWDGIQLSNAREGAKIHHNTVLNFGRINMGSQQAGIILGGNTNGEVYENTVEDGTGNGIQVFGYGLIKVYNNTIKDAGQDGTVDGQQSFFAHDFDNTEEVNAKQIDSVYSNTIINPKIGLGVFRVNDDFGELQRVSYVNNQICFSVTPPGGWETSYLQSGAPVTIRSGNTSISCTNQPPIANAGIDIITSLTSVTISGVLSADVDGTISTFTWSKTSGPTGGTIVSANSISTLITGLVEGVYIYTLTVEDNGEATDTDQVQITVTAAYIRQEKTTLGIKKKK